MSNSQPVVAVDLDGTLMNRGRINTEVLHWIKTAKSCGWTVILWSARGEQKAREAAKRLRVDHIFDSIIGKPTVVVDDNGWDWIRFTKVLRTIDDLEAYKPIDSL